MLFDLLDHYVDGCAGRGTKNSKTRWYYGNKKKKNRKHTKKQKDSRKRNRA